jgi:hypothetical protein
MAEEAKSERAAADGSALCAECGICCGWAIFAHVPLVDDEVAWAVRRRLPLVTPRLGRALELPCRVLESRANTHICGDYENRPHACRRFECKLLVAFKRGLASRAEAAARIAQAHDLITAVEERLSGIGQGRTMSARVEDLGQRRQQAQPDVAAHNAEALLDLAVLRAFLQKHFHDRAREPPDGDEAPSGV